MRLHNSSDLSVGRVLFSVLGGAILVILAHRPVQADSLPSAERQKASLASEPKTTPMRVDNLSFGTPVPTQGRVDMRAWSIRCWQAGQLVFQSDGMSPMTQAQGITMIASFADPQRFLQILDLFQGLCIVSPNFEGHD